MHYQRIEDAIKTCASHIATLDQGDLRNKELESYIVAGLVVLIVSEYEEYLEELFIKRAESCGDNYASNYIKITLSQKFRSPDMSKINETLSRFDVSYKVDFMGRVENSPHHAAWDSLLKARHAVVHKKGSLKLTFGELRGIYLMTKEVIDHVRLSLGVEENVNA